MYLSNQSRYSYKPETFTQDAAKTALSRIAAISGSDPGIFVLAVHSFIEGYIRKCFNTFGNDHSFINLVDLLYSQLTANTKNYIPGLGIFRDLKTAQQTTNAVRHEFSELTKQEAIAATHRLLKFISLIGIHQGKTVSALKKSLDLWDRSSSWLEDYNELMQKGFALHKTKNKLEELREELEEYNQQKETVSVLKKKAAELETQLEEKTSQKRKGAEKIDKLRQERWETQQKLKNAYEQLKKHENAMQYLQELKRITAFTRTRNDYEKSILKLTKEQERVLDQIKLQKDFLIKGAAGTGKTLVLLRALKKAKYLLDNELEFDQNSQGMALITYTRTLVKFDKYVASILSPDADEDTVTTAFSFISNLADSLDIGTIDFFIVRNCCKELYNGTIFKDDDEMRAEIEEFLFANMITKSEYIDEMIPRRGRKPKLTKEERKTVWEWRNEIILKMDDEKTYCMDYFCCRLLEAFQNSLLSSTHEFLFIDEVQDLSPAVLAVLKAAAKRAVIMAGDSDQAIYRAGFPFSRSKVDIKGRTRILRTNFRNTFQIHGAAENYRKRTIGEQYDTETEPEAFRQGPFPEVFQGDDKKELLKTLTDRIGIFIDELDYEAENICVLAPDKRDLQSIQKHLEKSGYNSGNIKDEEFDFSEPGLIRLSPLHSAKGLDFPVVLIYLTKLPFVTRGKDSGSRTKVIRNILYVALTRAMDHVNLFVLKGKKHPEIQDLVECLSS